MIRTENPFKPGDLVHVKENYISYLNLEPTGETALVVEVSGMIVRTLQEGAILTWMAWDLEESWLAEVEAVVLTELPKSMICMSECTLRMRFSESPTMLTFCVAGKLPTLTVPCTSSGLAVVTPTVPVTDSAEGAVIGMGLAADTSTAVPSGPTPILTR